MGLSATSRDLPPAVGSALTAPSEGATGPVDDGAATWATVSWGRAADPPVLLVHGVTCDSGIWWRVAPAIAAAGRHVVAVDLPGHGASAAWAGRHTFDETATDLAGFIRAADLDVPTLAVVGHSWGGMVVAHLPRAGLRPASIVLLDPPALPLDALELMTRDPTERRYDDVGEAFAVIRRVNP